MNVKLALAAIFSVAVLSCKSEKKTEKNSNESVVVAQKQPFFKISLAQWSLNEAIRSGEMNPLDFAEKAHEMGFEGVIISDALNMHAVSKKYFEKGKLEAAAFTAGMDVLCFSEHVAEGIERILNSAPENRIEESFKRIWQLKEKVFMNKAPRVNEAENPSDLNRTIAQNTLTELFGNPEKKDEIKNATFLNLSFAPNNNNIFSKKLEDDYQQKAWELSSQMAEIKLGLGKHQNVVLAIFPPTMKPKNQFGLDSVLLDFMQKLIAEKNVLVYLFGNPYVLDILGLKPTSNVVVVYQDFVEFQEEAINHFNGKTKAKGKLPIKLKAFQP